LHCCVVLEGEGVNSGVDRQFAEGADVGLIDLAYWSFGEEVNKVVFDLFVIVANFVGNGGKQDGVRGIERGDLLGISGLECAIPVFEQGRNVVGRHDLI